MSTDMSSGERKSHSLLLRKGSSNKIALKEKIVQIYEAFFQVSFENMIHICYHTLSASDR